MFQNKNKSFVSTIKKCNTKYSTIYVSRNIWNLTAEKLHRQCFPTDSLPTRMWSFNLKCDLFIHLYQLQSFACLSRCSTSCNFEVVESVCSQLYPSYNTVSDIQLFITLFALEVTQRISNAMLWCRSRKVQKNILLVDLIKHTFKIFSIWCQV